MESEQDTTELKNTHVFSQFYTRIFALSTALLLGLACYHIVLPFLGPLLWAMFLAFLLHPLHVRLKRRWQRRPDRAALLMTALTFIAIAGPLATLGAAFVHQANDLIQQLQAVVGGGTRVDWQHWVGQPVVQQPVQWLQDTFGITTLQIQSWITDVARAAMRLLASLSGQLFIGVLGTVLGVCLTVFLLFFFIRDGVTLLAAVRALVPLPVARREQLFEYLAVVTRAVVFGTGLTALIQGALVSVAFLIVQLPSPLVFGVLAGLLALLPIGGTAFIWLPAAIVLGLQGRWVAAVFMLLWGALLVSMIDNFLKPLLISGRAHVATLTILLGVLGGVTAFGAIGLFLGPVVLALAVALIQFALERTEAEQA